MSTRPFTPAARTGGVGHLQHDATSRGPGLIWSSRARTFEPGKSSQDEGQVMPSSCGVHLPRSLAVCGCGGETLGVAPHTLAYSACAMGAAAEEDDPGERHPHLHQPPNQPPISLLVQVQLSKAVLPLTCVRREAVPGVSHSTPWGRCAFDVAHL